EEQDVIAHSSDTMLFYYCSGPSVTLLIGSAFTGVYGLWAMFCMPGLRVPFRLKVPFLPSTKEKTLNVIKLLEGRKGHLADLGSGDGRLVFAASSMGFQCTGFKINSILLAYLRSNAWWHGIPHTDVVKQDFRRTDLCKYRNVTVFLAPAVVCCGIDMWGRVMVFILYKLYILSPYNNTTPNPTPYRKLHFYFLKKTHSVWFISVLKNGDMGYVLISHPLLVIPVSYPCHYTKLCPDMSQKHTHTYIPFNIFFQLMFISNKEYVVYAFSLSTIINLSVS
uniref:Uncharacterized protein n=1 Tax=Cyprinus carpio carpio TaxID=630221 RepID=A0A9J8AFB6_CYPCA